ncbi:UDP-N-acetylglucosamine transferase subunit ALG13 [Leeuwenhoekiella aestuarii]|uniref:glycosyltransferase n=1 Tax=Leeuwenhoekiella aestuarii TaxID=2249426 RepID=UPI001026AB33|nr:glycosyltransferase [Leeuwenhoekiella aestuarii]RXG12919.1 UDP-N-acetylglucosamine transferase subunit ALG13 [Leeuwenhoekiella aestuarii]
MMIFITTGTQEPFDRLLDAMDICAAKFPEVEFVAQVINTDVEAKNLKVEGFLSPITFNDYFERADLIVGHAGMGTIITALVKEKALIVIPRDASLGEHRNDHQLATAKKMSALNYVKVAYTSDELINTIDLFLRNEISLTSVKLTPYASDSLITELKTLFGNS